MATARWILVVALVIVLAVAAGVGLVALTPIQQRPALPPGLRLAGGAIALAGAALGLWTFRHHPARLMAKVTARTIEIAVRKRDPGESEVPRLITSGPYRLVRDPTYLSVLLVVLGLALALPLLGLFASAAILLVWWNAVVIPAEERELAARFGEAYEAYRGGTGRFLPRRLPRSRGRAS